jgi:uracil-DNA glycosylase
MNVRIEPGWGELLAGEFEKDYFVRLTDFVKREYAAGTVYPPGRNIFHAFDKCLPENLKVVIKIGRAHV